MKLNVLALYDMAAVNKPLPNRSKIRDYCDNQPLTHIVSRLIITTYAKEFRRDLSIAKGILELLKFRYNKL